MLESWRGMAGLLAERWKWQPTELYELDLDELMAWHRQCEEYLDVEVQAFRALAGRGAR